MRFDDKTVDWLTALLAEAAATEIMPRWRHLSAADIREKTSATDLVTEADVNAERLITTRLRERFPDALVVGEEAHAADPSVLDGLGEAPLAFVIDPVDGTFNFAAGLPLFGVMMAVVAQWRNGRRYHPRPAGQGLPDGAERRRCPHPSLRRAAGALPRSRTEADLADEWRCILELPPGTGALDGGAQSREVRSVLQLPLCRA